MGNTAKNPFKKNINFSNDYSVMVYQKLTFARIKLLSRLFLTQIQSEKPETTEQKKTEKHALLKVPPQAHIF